MGFGNFLRGIAAQVNPFDRGKTYGSYNPPRRKRPEDDPGFQTTLRVQNAQPTQRIVVDQPKPQKPANIFDTLNKSLTFGQPNPVVPVFKDANTSVNPIPAPGTVIKPTLKVAPASAQNLRVGNVSVPRKV